MLWTGTQFAPFDGCTDEVASVMSGVSITVKQEESLKTAAKLMVEHQIHHLLVVSEDKRLLGILSAIDYVRLVADRSVGRCGSGKKRYVSRSDRHSLARP